MLSFAHAFTGGVIVHSVDNSVIAFSLAIASHFVLDMLPHWNPNLPKENKKYGRIKTNTLALIFFDVIIALFLGLVLAYNSYMKSPHPWTFFRVILGSFFAVLPDLIVAPLLIFNKKVRFSKRLLEIQSKIQWNIPLPYGLITQIALVLILFLVFF